MIMLASDRTLMGRYANRPRRNAVAIAVAVFVALSGAAYGIDSFLVTVGIV